MTADLSKGTLCSLKTNFRTLIESTGKLHVYVEYDGHPLTRDRFTNIYTNLYTRNIQYQIINIVSNSWLL